MKTFLIIYSKTNNLTDLQARINSLGDVFFFMENHCLLSVVNDDTTAKDVYERLGDNSQLNSIYVTLINTMVERGYWGTMPSDFWDWLANHPSSVV